MMVKEGDGYVRVIQWERTFPFYHRRRKDSKLSFYFFNFLRNWHQPALGDGRTAGGIKIGAGLGKKCNKRGPETGQGRTQPLLFLFLPLLTFFPSFFPLRPPPPTAAQ